MNKKVGAAVLAGLLSAGGVVGVSAPVAADGHAYVAELRPWEQRRVDRAERWLDWAEQQSRAGQPAKAFQGYRRAVLELRGIEGMEWAISEIVNSARIQANSYLRRASTILARGGTVREQQLLDQGGRLFEAGNARAWAGGNLQAIEKFRRSFLRVTPIVIKPPVDPEQCGRECT